MKVTTKNGHAILELTPAQADKLAKLLRSPSGHCDWCDSVPECAEDCPVPWIERASVVAGREIASADPVIRYREFYAGQPWYWRLWQRSWWVWLVVCAKIFGTEHPEKRILRTAIDE